MSYFSFNIIGNAIDTAQQATTVTADNIANVSTPGASRQVADITEAVPISGSPFASAHIGLPGTRGEGAVVDQITRIHQDSYDGLFRGASSSQYYYTTQEQQLSTLQSDFGEPNSGISTAYAELQTSIANVASDPTSVAVRADVITQASTFATALNSASGAITQQEATVKSQATSVVTQANGLIDQIAALNGQIRGLTAVGDNPNTYLDQRDHAIDQLSKLVQTATQLQPNGSSLVTVGGRALVNDTVAYHLAAPVIGTNASGNPAFVIGFAGDPNPSSPAPVPFGSGQLGAFADVYNDKLVPYGQQLDSIASAAATEMNRVTQAGVDLNKNDGTALFAAAPGQTTINAATIAVALSDPTQLPLGFISTDAGTLTGPLNAANDSVSTAVPLNANPTVYNPPPAAGLSGTLTIGVDGATQTFAYSTASAPPGNATTIAGFMTSFNAGHFGVTASFDASTQRIGFTRDPNNIDAVHRALQGTNAPTPGFTMSDSLGPAAASTPAGQGVPATGLLEALGAQKLNGVPQTAANAYGSADNGAANALLRLYSQNVGIGALQTTAGSVVANGGNSYTLGPPAGDPQAYATLAAGQVLTVVDTAAVPPTQQNITVTGVDQATGTLTISAASAPVAGNALTTAQSQTLGAAYGSLTTRMALDTKAAITGVATQTSLASNIDTARQGVDGINIDEETQNLLRFQSAYTAAAKTLSTLNAMMQTALGLIAAG